MEVSPSLDIIARGYPNSWETPFAQWQPLWANYEGALNSLLKKAGITRWWAASQAHEDELKIMAKGLPYTVSDLKTTWDRHDCYGSNEEGCFVECFISALKALGNESV